MRLVIRIHDADGLRLKEAESEIRRMVKEYCFEADIYQVAEYLEHGRLGIAHLLPVLEMNNQFVTFGVRLNEKTLRPIFEKLNTIDSQKRHGAH